MPTPEANQVITIDLSKLQKYVHDNPPGIDTLPGEIMYTQLRSLPAAAYLPSLAKLYELEDKINDPMDVNLMIAAYTNMLDLCMQDLKNCMYDPNYSTSRVAFNQIGNIDLGNLEGNIEKIKRYKDKIFPKINTAHNEKLIIPAIEMASECLKLLKKHQKKPTKLKDLLVNLKEKYGDFQKLVQEVQNAQIDQTAKDLGQRNGIIVEKLDETFEYIPPNPQKISYDLKNQINMLREYGLNGAQINFITHQCNQSNIDGSYLAALQHRGNIRYALSVRIKGNQEGSKQVIINQISYNCLSNIEDPTQVGEYMGKSMLTVDISSLEGEEYKPGIYKDVSMNLTSDFFNNPKAQRVEWGGIENNFSIPEVLLGTNYDGFQIIPNEKQKHELEIANQEFAKYFASLEKGILKCLPTKKATRLMTDVLTFPEVFNQMVESTDLFNNPAFLQEFITSIYRDGKMEQLEACMKSSRLTEDAKSHLGDLVKNIRDIGKLVKSIRDNNKNLAVEFLGKTLAPIQGLIFLSELKKHKIKANTLSEILTPHRRILITNHELVEAFQDLIIEGRFNADFIQNMQTQYTSALKNALQKASAQQLGNLMGLPGYDRFKKVLINTGLFKLQEEGERKRFMDQISDSELLNGVQARLIKITEKEFKKEPMNILGNKEVQIAQKNLTGRILEALDPLTPFDHKAQNNLKEEVRGMVLDVAEKYNAQLSWWPSIERGVRRICRWLRGDKAKNREESIAKRVIKERNNQEGRRELS